MSDPQVSVRPTIRPALVIGVGAFMLLLVGLVWTLLAVGVFFAWNSQTRPAVATAPRQSEFVVLDRQTVEASPAPPRELPANSRGIGAQIAERVASTQQQSVQDKLSELDTMSQRLSSVASDESVEKLAKHFQGWMGLEARAAQPTATSTVSEFDIDSAQLHDVTRTELRTGRFEYQAVLIDARGRTLEVKMTDAEGENMHALMRRLKDNPLLEKIYRRIAMPLLDNIVRSAREQAKPAPATRVTP